MLSTSQRPDSAYTLTARLMGDPRPDRFEISEKRRAHVRVAHTIPGGLRKPYVRAVKKSRTHHCLELVRDGYSTVGAVREQIGCSYRTTGDHMRLRAKNGWIKIKMIVPADDGGRIFIYAITDRGREELKKLSDFA